ncbi:hypothetical protein Fluta_0339 [Fluviicola taffensis DSM 16823]|jgi:hypothetical protein|uniref:Uncharacterized protein n=1 Tax=Fluviicola taffensis (strain DSM 16823 / NCIMB 13979 / RW262) TaxID=755732 RepID=F2IDH1_FLUTR|nr:hypothetical protein Fluta_0339 [Fluviicola taffensis DSM 16823]
MRLLLQIILYFFTCFISSALPIAIGTAPKIVIPTHRTIFHKTENFGKSEKSEIGLENFARSSLEEQQSQTTTFHQNTFLLSSYLKEENSCAFDFQKTGFPYQFKVAQFSKNLLI